MLRLYSHFKVKSPKPNFLGKEHCVEKTILHKVARGLPKKEISASVCLKYYILVYPDGKIDILSGKGRQGGVRYTDYAIGKFIEEAKKRPWFDNTIFVIVADHTAGSSGKLDLTPDKHHIPMMFYAPKLIKPQVVDTLASQIDLAPTLLGLMKAQYDSRFYGRDLLKPGESRAFIANYQHVGLLKQDSLTILKPVKNADTYKKENGEFTRQDTVDKDLVSEIIAYFQNASRWKELNHNIPH